jgi:exosortase/archaeosortase family protein
MTDGSDEPLGILALLTALILVWRERTDTVPGRSINQTGFVPPAILLLVYAITYPVSPPLIRAALAVTALSVTLSSLLLGTRFHLALTGLLLLSLPVVSSLQFYLGYPLRILCGSISLPILSVAGFPVSLEGTSLRYGDLLVSIDAPCSGVRMLWTGLFLTFTLACVYHLKTKAVIATCGISIFLLVLANSWRTAALFLLEAYPILHLDWLHGLTGTVIFAMAGIAMVVVAKQLSGGRLCATPASS